MTTIELDIRDFPADVQDMLRDRAIKQRKPIGEIVADYVMEVARAIVAAGEPDSEAA